MHSDNLDAAQAACQEMRGHPLGGNDRRLRVDFADPNHIMSPERGENNVDRDGDQFFDSRRDGKEGHSILFITPKRSNSHSRVACVIQDPRPPTQRQVVAVTFPYPILH
jgi:hypothetical protein